MKWDKKLPARQKLVPINELFLKESEFKKLKLTDRNIDLACTFLLKVKDKNHIKIKKIKQKTGVAYSVVVRDNKCLEQSQFKSKRDAETFVDTVRFINNLSQP